MSWTADQTRERERYPGTAGGKITISDAKGKLGGSEQFKWLPMGVGIQFIYILCDGRGKFLSRLFEVNVVVDSVVPLS